MTEKLFFFFRLFILVHSESVWVYYSFNKSIVPKCECYSNLLILTPASCTLPSYFYYGGCMWKCALLETGLHVPLPTETLVPFQLRVFFVHNVQWNQTLWHKHVEEAASLLCHGENIGTPGK